MGLSIVKALASNPAKVIFAGARTPANSTALHELAKTSQAKINVIGLVSADTESNKKAAEEIKKAAGRVDVIIANAGLGSPEGVVPLHESDPAQWVVHYEVNLIGPVVLFKEFHSLLRASAVAPKFVVVSSIAGSLALASQFNLPFEAYSASQAAVNYAAIKIHLENEDSGLIAFPVHPGAVKTDMTHAAFKKKIPTMTRIRSWVQLSAPTKVRKRSSRLSARLLGNLMEENS
ncbi:Predicted short chain-type dehydrogenase [Phaffia rhodozyma]|uniref:Predicted short chain-type dehydrogenase n=1 Tax=Phaffia rhodozyma TaxID=264483 RepID=A0A0F7SF68_PHARH|nr:Predicted short chain-type dehydrogenase [Phaffia rhodozyma]